MSGYPYSTKAWRDLRRAKLSAQPTCEVCERRGRTVLAIAVDHIVAINKGGEAFPPLDRLMSMCEPCHSYKTNHEDRPARRRKLGSPYKGSAVDGGSLDPDDDWSAPVATHGPQRGDPPAFGSRGSAGLVPAAYTKTELVPASDSQLEYDRWV